jgi:KDO2-lipid IV(A) lauroyltransferase
MALVAVATIAGKLPAAPLYAAADATGELWYRIAPAKRAQARANLQRVCDGLAAASRGSALARRAATDPDALERLVRACFRHAARYYVEVARTGGYDLETVLATLDIATPDEVREGFMTGRPVILVGMHYGVIELPVLYLSNLIGHSFTAPMETVADPGLQHWFITSRSRVGVNIVPIRNARRSLLAAIRRGESVGLVADRDLAGSGIPVPFFGYPAPIPIGPAMLALETGAPMYVAVARRTRDGRCVGRVIHVPTPEAGSRRERVHGMTRSMVTAFESLLGDAPEQWWGAFHPVWPDIAGDGSEGAAAAPATPGAAPRITDREAEA